MSGAAPARSQPGRQNTPQQRQRADEKNMSFECFQIEELNLISKRNI